MCPENCFKTLARDLITDGILDKEIARKQLKYRCDSIRVAASETGLRNAYVIRLKGKGMTGQPRWTPSSIDTNIWARASSQFHPYVWLAENVEKYLLPEMDDYLQSLSDSQLVSMVRDFLLEYGVIRAPIRQSHGDTYYFTEDEVYTLDRKSKLFPYDRHLKFTLFRIRDETCFSVAVWNKAVTRFELGMSLGECIEVFLDTNIEKHPSRQPSHLEQLVQEISPPVYEREPENDNAATFDRVRIYVGLPCYQFPS